jgi:hypothetical protein
MATKTRTKRKPMMVIEEPAPATESERIEQSIREWHRTTRGVIAGVREITVDVLNELQNRKSPFHDTIKYPKDLELFLNNLDDADCYLTNLLLDEPEIVSVAIHNPVEHLRGK